MKNHLRHYRDIYRAPERPMSIDGPALPRWTPPPPMAHYLRRAQGRRDEALTRPVLIPVHLHGHEAIGDLFAYRVRVKTDIEAPSYPDLATLDLDATVGTEVTVSIDVPGKGTFVPGMPGDTGRGNIGFYVRRICGRVSAARFVQRDDRAMVYEFDLEPALKQATLGQNWRIWQNCTVIEAMRELLAPYAMTVDWRIGGPLHGAHYPRRDLQRQYWESDYTCFKRWCERAGLFFWFEHEAGRHTLVIADTMSAFQRHGEAHATLRYAPGENRVDEETIERLEFSSRQTAGKATAVDHDYMQPRLRRANAPVRASGAHPRDTANADQEYYAYANISQPLQGAMGLHGRAPDLDEQALQAATVRMQSMRCEGLRARGHGHLRALIPGKTFDLAGYPLRDANREYAVVSATLTIEANDQSSGTHPVFRCETQFELYPLREGHFRLPIVTPWPVAGSESGIVTGPEGNAIWTDAQGRVKCQLVPDRASRYDENAFIWLRVMQPWQGAQTGSAFVPRVGSEIIVGYVNGNPDMPYILGSATSKDNTPAWELPRNQWVSGLRSRMQDGFASNHLALDDTHGKQQAQLASDHAKSSLSLGYVTRIDGNRGRQDERGEGFELRTDQHGALRAARGMLLSTHERTHAAGKIKEMGETHARLTAARDTHESVTQLAQQRGAQQGGGDQADVVRAIKQANADLRGESGAFPEFSRPDIAVSSAANVHLVAAHSTHIASDRHTALTTGGHVAIAAGTSLFASVRHKLAFYAQKAMTLVASGPVRVESRQDTLDVIARKVINILSEQDEIRLTGKRIVLNGGGSQLEIGPQGVIGHTNGAFLVHAASHATANPEAKPVSVPVTEDAPGKLGAHHVLVEPGGGFAIAGQPYRLTLEDGQVIEGVTNALGELLPVTSNVAAFGWIELMSQSEPGHVVGVSETTVYDDAGKVAENVAPVAPKRQTQVGGKTVSTPDTVVTSEAKPPVFFTCDPLNFGLRTYRLLGKAKEGDVSPIFDTRRDIEYPVVKAYTAAIKKSLVSIDWATAVAGLPIGELKRIVVQAVQQSLHDALQYGAFGLPTTAAPGPCMPNVALAMPEEFEQYGMKPEYAGCFSSFRWEMAINFNQIKKISKSKNNKSKFNPYAELANTVFHEARHCQQKFWKISLFGSNRSDYTKFKNMSRYLAATVENSVLNVALNTAFPNDERVRIAIHRMLMFDYYWTIKDTEHLSSYEFMQSDLELVEASVCALLNVTPDVARAMTKHETGYRSQLDEEDAFTCGDMVNLYWISDNPILLPNPGSCSKEYSDTLIKLGVHGSA